MGHLFTPQVTLPSRSRDAILFRDGLAAPEEAASLLCTNPCATWPISDTASLTAALTAADAARQAGQVAVFALDYEAGVLIEPAAQPARQERGMTSGRAVPVGHVWIFPEGRWLTQAQADAWLMQDVDAGHVAGCVRGKPVLDEVAYTRCLQRIQAAIAEGAVYQINYTFPVDVTLYGDPAQVFLGLAKAQPTAYAVYIDMPECRALSLSPELFFCVDDDRVMVRPMKGTAPRLADVMADRAQADALRASAKNRAENLMIVDLLRNDLGRVAVSGSVTVDRLFEIETYPTVHQMTSTVSARLQTQSLDSLVRGLFPCGSVTGAPKVAAMQKIATLERSPRGLYTGAIGWATAASVRANVAIRTIVLDPPSECVSSARTGVLGVGSGIVWDSDPADEYAECLLKSAFLVKPDPGFTLFETLRLELPPETLAMTLPLVEVYPLIRRHAARLAQSSYALGFTFDSNAFEAALWQVKNDIRQQQGPNDVTRVFRVRIDLAHDGALKTTWAPLPPMAQRVGLIWSDQRLVSDAPLLRHKTSARSVYNRAVDRAMAQQAFDSLFCNERGDVCEGARSNIFVREGARLLTPPVRCGLLPGVLRSALLDSGEACEVVLTVADIKAASREGRLRVGNALRGLVPATLK